MKAEFPDTDLPLAPFLHEICSGLNEKGAAVVRADPGSGKSTLLPLSLLRNSENHDGKIILLEPRRAAALGIAARMAELLGEKPGERVGYAVRLERKISPLTRIEVLTEGLFLRRIQADPSLAETGTVIFDEFHERSCMTDLTLAFLLDLRRMGSRVKILIMSATMNAAETAAFINRAENRAEGNGIPVFDIPGRFFPVETEYRPLPRKASMGSETGAALPRILEKGEGDTLVFLPGRREIADAEKTFRLWGGAENFELLPLHGGLPLARQREIIAPEERGGTLKRRRVILSTNIAESALTIPGIDLVVDSGYVRLERFHVPTALNRLSLEEAGMTSADQRAGRAGRLGPGRCVRLWDPSLPRPASTDPEIRRIDLSGLALECFIWGIRSRADLPWLEIPPAAAWERARELLTELGTVDKEGNPTVLGKEAVRLGLEPRLGVLCLAGKKTGRAGLASAAAAILSGRDSSMINGDSDFRSRLALLRNARAGTGKAASAWAKSVKETKDDLIRRLNLSGKTESGWTIEEEADIGELLAAAFPDRVAVKRERGRFRLSSGREARVEGPLEASAWLIAAEVDAGERSGFIRLAAPVSEESALAVLEKQTVIEIRVEWKGLVPKTVVTRRAGRLVLGEERRPSSRREAAGSLVVILREKGLAVLPWEEGNAAPRHLLERIRFFARHAENANSRDWDDEVLLRAAEEWLVPFIEARDSKDAYSGPVLSPASLINALKNRFGWDLVPVLEKEAPRTFTLPSGREKIIDYASGEPVLAARLQDCFGIEVHPRIMGVPIVFHLLSPANRPVQITQDIAGFWSGSYADVRKDMKGRYPKHHWPVDPKSGL